MADNGNQGNGDQGQESGTGNGDQGQEPGAGREQNGNQGGKPGQESGGGGGGQGKDDPPDFGKMTEAELREYATRAHKDLGKVRQEAAQHRTRATNAEAKVSEAERAKMTEQERLETDLATATEENKTLKAQVEDLTRGVAVREALVVAGALNPAAAYKVGNWSGVKLDEDGSVNHDSFKAAVDKLRKSDAYLFRRGASADAGAGREQSATPQGGGGINALIRGGGR